MIPRVFRTIAFRLSLMYAAIFTFSAFFIFVLFYLIVSHNILQNIDRELKNKAEIFSAVLSTKGIEQARRLAVMEAQAAGEKMIFFRLLYPSGEVFASSHMSYWQDIKADPAIIDKIVKSGKRYVFDTAKIKSRHERIRILYVAIAPRVILQTGLAMKTYYSFLDVFKKVFITTVSFVILFSVFTGWLLAKKALSGVGKVTETARRITGTNLNLRVPETGNRDELDQLAGTFNQMLDRIEELVTNTREMNDNIAHDLKSPVARIRGLAEVSLLQEDGIGEYRKMASSAIEESDRLLDMINTMLLISKAEAGEATFDLQELDISALMKNAGDFFLPLFEEAGVKLILSIREHIMVRGDERMLQRTFSNILDNAFKYTADGGSVTVTVRERESGWVDIEISDTGIGIDKQNQSRIFDRFYREDPARSEKGTGLGLSLVKAVITEHGGRIDVSSTKGAGTRFTVTLPNCNLQVI